MGWMLGQMDLDSASAQWFWWVAWIMLIGGLSVLFFAMMWVGRRWKRRQLDAIDVSRRARRAYRSDQSIGRVDAWAAGSDRYIDRDKLTDDSAFVTPEDWDDLHDDENDDTIPENDFDESDASSRLDQDDPYGLFADKPYKDPEDADETFEGDDDDDWSEDEER